MQFTGKNLQTVVNALHGAISDVQMHIGSCPDVIEYAQDIEDYEAEKEQYQRLLNRILKRHPEMA